ncbi:MAG: hypothetical protein HYY56_05400 [Candidatus Omnitrophica bacterium]|nr:hypothetical protein [Candidatus Omnitrophota bacterium]
MDKVIKDFHDSKIFADAKRLLDICSDKSDREQWLQSHICEICSGSGKCPSCTGKGESKCNICKGSGVEKVVEELGPKCLICDGTGYKIKNYNGISGAENRCPHCDGKGRLSGKKSEIACKYCLGTGEIKCQVCNGTGVCSTCSGKGFIGIPPESTPPKVVPKEPEKTLPRLCWGCRGAGYYKWPPGDEAARKVCRICRGIGYLP